MRRFLLSFVLLLGMLLGVVSLAAALFDVKKAVSRYQKPDAKGIYKRTFAINSPRGRRWDVPVHLSREAVEMTEKGYGISKDDLHQALLRNAERFMQLNSGKGFRVEISKDNTYRYWYKNEYAYLVNEYGKSHNKAYYDYYSSHFLPIKGTSRIIDYPGIQQWQASPARPVYDSLSHIARAENMNEREFITLMAGFVQQMPYKIPPNKWKGRVIDGLWPPIVALNEGKGDCDTKTTLFATIFYHHRKQASIAILTRKHAFIGIKDQHRVFPRDRIARIGGREYLLVEMTYPWEMGKIGTADSRQVKSGKFRYMEFH